MLGRDISIELLLKCLTLSTFASLLGILLVCPMTLTLAPQAILVNITKFLIEAWASQVKDHQLRIPRGTSALLN